MKTATKPRGRKQNTRPANELHALFCAEFGPEIKKFFHREPSELSMVRQAAYGEGFPALTAEWETDARARLSNVDNVAGCIAEIRANHDSKRVAWECLIIERWQAGDAEFFELLAIMRRGDTDEAGKLKRAALLYIRLIRDSGLTPCLNSFLKWLRRNEKADIMNISRADGMAYIVIHRELAKRALAWAMPDSES